MYVCIYVPFLQMLTLKLWPEGHLDSQVSCFGCVCAAIFSWCLLSGADLANLINQAAIKGSADGRECVTIAELDYAKDKILMGKGHGEWLGLIWSCPPHRPRETQCSH